MTAHEQMLARRILEAGRAGAREEGLLPTEDKRAWLQELREAGLEKVWQLECQLVPVVASMRERGFRVDAEKLEGLAKKAEKTGPKRKRKCRRCWGSS